MALEQPELSLTYTNTLEDMLAFQDYHISHDPSAQRLVLRSRLVGGLAVAVLIGFYGSTFSKSLIVALPLALVAAVAFFALFPRFVRLRMRKQFQARHAQGRDKKFVCEHKMALTDSELRVKTPYESTTTPLSEVKRVELTDTHGFIRIGTLGGYIVPLETSEGDAAQFLTLLRERVEAGQEPTAVGATA